MCKIILLIVVLFPAILFGQSTKKVTDKDKHEVYYVLKSDKTIRQGSYKKSGWNGKPLIDGYYKNGMKDSIWTFYDNSGQVNQKYDYIKKEFIFEKADTAGSNDLWPVIKGSDTIKTKLDKHPNYIGGSNVLYQFLADNLDYPDSAKDLNKMGTVKIIFTVDKNGKAINHRVIQHVYPCLDREAMRVVKLLPNEWEPAILNGEKVDASYTLPIRFVLR